MLGWLEIALLLGQFIFTFVFIICMFSILPTSSVISHSKKYLHKSLYHDKPPDVLMRVLRLSEGKLEGSARVLLWKSCGIQMSATWYVAIRSFVMYLIICIGIVLWVAKVAVSIYVSLALAFIIAALLTDTYWLKTFRDIRSIQLTKEIFVISNQLLYFSDSKLHIHTKLRKCVKFSKLLRKDFEILLAEWYHDPYEALQKFKKRLATEDGMSFVETIDAIRLHDSKEYYDLLKTRINDYKEKLELAKESRKESASYLLFVIAGIPILYTFQVFIYPWTQEIQQLMKILG